MGSRGGGSASASLNYLLDKPEGEVEVLQGNPELSKKIAESLTFKNKYTVGVLSFEEPSSKFTNEQKREIMAKFEDVMFSGLKKEQYNIVWIQHTDRGRLELNFFVPNVEMTTGKRLQIYYDKADRHLVDNFKKVINYEHQLSDPDNPSKAQEFILNRNTPKTKQELSRAISDYIYGLLSTEQINDREGVLRALESKGIEIARVTSKNISIKDPDGGQNIRLRGAFYEQTFRAEKYYGAGSESRQREYEANRTANYERAKQQLAVGMSKREQQFQQKYGDRTAEIDLTYQNDVQGKQIRDTDRDLNSSDDVGRNQLPNDREISRNDPMGAISRDLQGREQGNDVQAMPDGANSDDLHRDRAELSGNNVGQGNVESSQSVPNENNNQEGGVDDRSGRTFFDNLKEFGQEILGRASDFIDAVKAFGERLFGAENKLRPNADVASQIEQRTSENERAISANEPSLQREQEIAVDKAKTKEMELTL